ISVACGGNKSVHALQEDGEIVSWGRGESGELGDNTNANKKSSPVLVNGGKTYKQVIAGDARASVYAIDVEGNAWAWGINDEAQLGIGAYGNAVSVPTIV